MLIENTINHQGWSGRIRRRGIRRVAREAGLDLGYVSRAVNNRVVVTKKQLEKLTIATNKLAPLCQIKKGGGDERPR